MNPTLAQQQITKAILEYDDGTMTMSALMEVVSVTLTRLDKSSFDSGYGEAAAEYNDDEIIFESDMELENPYDNDDSPEEL